MFGRKGVGTLHIHPQCYLYATESKLTIDSGGRDAFKWEDVKDDQHRENYLGHSLMARKFPNLLSLLLAHFSPFYIVIQVNKLTVPPSCWSLAEKQGSLLVRQR